MTHVWLDWLVKVAVATAVIALVALAAGLNQAVAEEAGMLANRSAVVVPAKFPAEAQDHLPEGVSVAASARVFGARR